MWDAKTYRDTGVKDNWAWELDEYAMGVVGARNDIRPLDARNCQYYFMPIVDGLFEHRLFHEIDYLMRICPVTLSGLVRPGNTLMPILTSKSTTLDISWFYKSIEGAQRTKSGASLSITT